MCYITYMKRVEGKARARGQRLGRGREDDDGDGRVLRVMISITRPSSERPVLYFPCILRSVYPSHAFSTLVGLLREAARPVAQRG